MGRNTGIEWTDHTWNPWRGCKKVSSGCKNCYMFREQDRYGRDPNEIVRAAKKTFEAPLHWGEEAFVFTCSWSDFFIEEADEWRPEAWEIIKATPCLTYQILTKRPRNIEERLPEGWPLKNVWLGVSVENQQAAEMRMPILCEIPAALRFVSVEPMLGIVHLEKWHDKIGWVICGGESGLGHRETHKEWVEELCLECVYGNVLFWFKQWGGTKKIDGTWGGCEIDGAVWNQRPRRNDLLNLSSLV